MYGVAGERRLPEYIAEASEPATRSIRTPRRASGQLTEA